MTKKELNKEDLFIKFLLKETIRPKELTKTQKSDSDIEPGRLWDAIKKAHRDVVTGVRTGNIEKYRKANCKGADTTLKALYNLIQSSEESLSSRALIEALTKDNTIEFSAIQKLVNMTLKYLIVLRALEGFSIEIDEANCDCPIDSIILDKLSKLNNKHTHTCWTSMEEDEYKTVQDEIKIEMQNSYPDENYGNIWFDFLEWKNDDKQSIE